METRSLDAGGRRWPVEKAFWTFLVLVGGLVGYYVVALSLDPAHARSLATAFDQSVPFSPWWMVAYAGVYTGFTLPVFVVRCDRLFRRLALGFLFILLSSYAVFCLMPVTSKGFRPEPGALDATRFVEWGAAVAFTLDPPMNCFPSLHVATIVFAALVARKADRLVGTVALVLAGIISVSTLLVKQHYLADVVAGLVLAVIAYLLCVRAYDPAGQSELEVRHSRLGFVLYVLVYLAAVFLLLLPLHLLGWKPWEHASAPGAATASRA